MTYTDNSQRSWWDFAGFSALFQDVFKKCWVKIDTTIYEGLLKSKPGPRWSSLAAEAAALHSTCILLKKWNVPDEFLFLATHLTPCEIF